MRALTLALALLFGAGAALAASGNDSPNDPNSGKGNDGSTHEGPGTGGGHPGGSGPGQSLIDLPPGFVLAFHREGHDMPFPGAPSGQFVLFTIPAGANCTDTFVEPDGLDTVLHGGPKKYGFIGEELIETVVISEDPDVVQVCLAEGIEPMAGDVAVRVSFEGPEDEEAFLGAEFVLAAGDNVAPGSGNWGGGPGNSGPGDKGGQNDKSKDGGQTPNDDK